MAIGDFSITSLSYSFEVSAFAQGPANLENSRVSRSMEDL
jgi:hypothetical protein